MDDQELIADRRSSTSKINIAKALAAKKNKDKLKDSDLIIQVRGKSKKAELEQPQESNDFINELINLRTENQLLKLKMEKAKKKKAAKKLIPPPEKIEQPKEVPKIVEQPPPPPK